jgi:hypothetical protein
MFRYFLFRFVSVSVQALLAHLQTMSGAKADPEQKPLVSTSGIREKGGRAT